ncbi:hypothetical protein DV738_g2998, partial [Chaetothyriales sp. CBS 135597]
MAEWKDRGYVPDSDDEEDSIPCAHLDDLSGDRPHLQSREGEGSCLEQPGTPPLQRPASQRLPSSSPRPLSNHFEIVVSPTASKLQAELHRGLQACKDVLTTAPDLAAYLEEEDSPLSSLASSPSLGPVPSVEDSAPQPPASPQQQQPAEPPSVAVINSSPPGLRLDDVPDASYLSAGPVRRSLRPRTLLQLNPYSLEYARYQQECSRRGIVPVRLANFAAERAKANSKDTQLSDPFQESDFTSSPTRSPASAIGTGGDRTDGSIPLAGSPPDIWSTLGDDDELPDLSDILSHHPVGKFRWQHTETPHTVKPVVSDKADDEPVFKEYKLPWQISTSRQDKVSARQPSVFDHPLSPAPSETVASDQLVVHTGDDLPAVQITPAPLPTPAVSSDRAHSKRKLVVLSDSSQEETSPGHPESQSSESENDDSQGLLQIRRRIRGVLPASWLKLEAKQRPQKIATQPHTVSENIVLPVKGVAKHISPNRPRDTPRSSAHKSIIFSSDAEDDATSENDRENERPRPSPNHLTNEGAWESDVEMDELAIEDEIDRMLPSVRRTINPRRPKTQRILGDSWSNLAVPKPPQKQSSITKPRASTRRVATRPAIKRRKTKHRAHQLTVLDAPGFTLNGTRPPPQYLRIAARKRPSRRAALPQNVAHKFVRLPDLREAVDAASTRHEGRVRRPSRTCLPRQQRSNIDLTEGVADDERYQQDHADTEGAESLDDLKQSTAAIRNKATSSWAESSFSQRTRSQSFLSGSIRSPELAGTHRPGQHDFEVLLSSAAARDILAVSITYRSSTPTSVIAESNRLGLLAVQFCYLATRQWQWTSSDAVVKFWFKQYAQNDMIELFVVPDVGRVTERSKRAVLGLETEHSDTDYDIFLKSVAALLVTRAQSMALYGDDVGRAAGRIQSLVFSISPNNSRKLSDDQSLHLEDLVSMANIYALYEYLNEFAPPGCQPRFALVEKLIDFPNCHWSVSQFALRTWSRFAHNAITRGDISMLSTLGSWIKRMTEQMALKLSPVPSDHYEPRPSGAEYALQRNAARTRQQISELLSTWKSALARCPTDDECKALLNGGAIGPIVDFCKDRRLCTADVVTNICELVHKYLDRADTDPSNLVRATLHKQFRQIMIATLSPDNQGSTECLKPLTSLWYHFARITVRNKQKTWDDYLSLPSSWSFGLLAASDSSRQCKVLFLKMILEHDMMYFELDHEPFYSAWIQGIVQPQCNLLFEHELTKTIILHETDEMSFQDLRSMLQGAQGQLRLDMADFIQNQFEIVKHVIRSIFLLQFDDEDSQDYLGKPLNIDQGRRLLRLITDTMKACWRALPVANRGPYAEFARSVVTQLRIYKYKDFDIDPWFIDPLQPEFPKEVPFASQFLLPINQPRPELDDRLIRIFTVGNLQAAGTGHECSWAEDIVRALSATSATTAVDTKGRLALNSDLQFAFMREVMSVYVYSMFQSPGHALFARPVLTGVLAIVRNWHFRLDINLDSVLCQILFTAVDLLASVFEALTTVRARLASFIGHGGDIGALISVLIDLSSACVRRATMLEALVEKSQENMDAVEKGFACANMLYETLLPLSPGRHHRAGITTGGENANDTGISIEMVRLHKTTLMSKTQTLLEESLRGRNGQCWRIDHPLANSWEAWMVNSDEAAGDFSISLMNLRHALMEADVLLVDDGNDWAEGQNEYIERWQKQHGKRLDHDERVRKRLAREGHAAQPLPNYLLDRSQANNAKALSSAIKNKRAEKAAKFSVPLPKVKGISEEEMFKVVKTGKKTAKKSWKRMITQPTFVGPDFTRRPVKYERFIRPMGLRYKKANVTHPELGVTVQLPILGVKKNPQNPLYTQLGVLSKGTVIEVNVSELGITTAGGKVVWGKYAQVTNDPSRDGCLNAVLLV